MSPLFIVGFALGVGLFLALMFSLQWVIWQLRGKPFLVFPGSNWDGPLMLSNLWASEAELDVRRRIWANERWIRLHRKYPSTYSEIEVHWRPITSSPGRRQGKQPIGERASDSR